MCGRFVQHISEPQWGELLAELGAAAAPLPPARYNVAPTQPMAGVVWAPGAQKADPTPSATSLAFGISHGAQRLVINARAETLTERRMFSGLLAHHRALVVASAFYEWAPAAQGGKQPYCFARSDGAPFYFAALIEQRTVPTPGAVLVTTDASAAVAPVHARMPVMLDADAARLWLDPRHPVPEVLPLLTPYTGRMRVWPVSRAVNNPRHDAADCQHALRTEA